MSGQRLSKEVLESSAYLREHFHCPSPEYDAVLKSAITGQKLELGYETIGEWLTENPNASQEMKEEEMRVVIETICKDPIIVALTSGTCPTSFSTSTKDVTKRLTALLSAEVDSSPTVSQLDTGHHAVTTSPGTQSKASSPATSQPSTGHHTVTSSPGSQSKASSSATTVSMASPTFTISKLDNLGTAITYYRDKKINFPLLCFENSKYSLSFLRPGLDAMNLKGPSTPFYHSLLVKLYLRYSDSKLDEFLALPLGRIQSQRKLTYWVVWMKIKDGSLYALRPIDVVDEDSDVDIEDKLLDEDLLAFGIPILEIPQFGGWKAVLLGTISSKDSCTMEKLDIICWETVRLTTAEVSIFKSRAGL